MQTRFAVVAALAVVGGAVAGPATAADKVPVKLKVKDCDGCSVSATWNSNGKSSGKIASKTKKVRGDKATLRFKVPKGYYLYFAATSPNAQVDAASILVTRYAGAKKGEKLSASKIQTLNKAASYCMRAKKRTVRSQAALIPYDGATLLGFWANPQLKKMGNKVSSGINGVFGTQNTLLCKGKYY